MRCSGCDSRGALRSDSAEATLCYDCHCAATDRPVDGRFELARAIRRAVRPIRGTRRAESIEARAFLLELGDDDDQLLAEIRARGIKIEGDRASLVRRPRFAEMDKARIQGWRDFAAETESITAITAESYVERLAEVELVGGRGCCPFHDGENSQSLRISETGWHCYACGAGGGIYQFAAALWGLGTKGDDFKRVHDRLVAELEVA